MDTKYTNWLKISMLSTS